MKIHRISPTSLKTSRFFENEPAEKKSTLEDRNNFSVTTSSHGKRKFWEKDKKPSNLKMFSEYNHATERKMWKNENAIFRGEERSDKLKDRKEERKGWDCIFIDASTKHWDLDNNVSYRRRTRHRHENYNFYQVNTHIPTHWKHLWWFSTRKNSWKKNSSSTSICFLLVTPILRLRKCLSGYENIWRGL